MRVFAVLLFLLAAGFGWAMWHGVPLAASWLAATDPPAPEELALESAVADQGSASLEATLESEAAGPQTGKPAPEVAEPTSNLPLPQVPTAGTPAPEVANDASAPVLAEPALVVAVLPDTRRVVGDRVNLRQGSNVGTNPIDVLSLDDVVEVLDRGGDWLRVRTLDDKEGWVAAQYLAPPAG